MNSAQKDAIESALVNLQDDLYRYQLAEKRHPGSKTGNGEPYIEVITDLEKRIAELRGNS